MKSVINIEVILVLIFIYFIIGDPLSLASFSSTLIGKLILFLLLLIFSSYNVIYGLVFLVLILHISENQEGLAQLKVSKDDYKHVSSGVKESLKMFKCNKNNESTLENWRDYVVFADGKECDPCKPDCKGWKMKETFKLQDENELISLEKKLFNHKSYPVLNKDKSNNVSGFNLK